MGARLDNAALLHRAGVRIMFAVSSYHRTYNAGSAARLGAGLAVANGLPWIEGLRALTSAPAAVFGIDARYGTVAKGKDADLVLWDGDPLEPATLSGAGMGARHRGFAGVAPKRAGPALLTPAAA